MIPLSPQQASEVEPAGRGGSGSQDRLAALEAVANLGAPVEVFDSEGECLGLGGLMGALPGTAVKTGGPHGTTNDHPPLGRLQGSTSWWGSHLRR